MQKRARQIEPLLQDFSDQQLQPLFKVLKCLNDQGGAVGEILLADLATRAGIQAADVESAVLALQKVHKATHDFSDTSGGVGVYRPSPPKIKKKENGELYVANLSGLPLKEMMEIFSKREMRQRLEKPATVFYEGFDLENSTLYFAGTKIPITAKGGKENNPTRLLETLTKDVSRVWFEDEVLSDWEGRMLNVADLKRMPRNRVYHAAQKLNQIIAAKVQVPDFIKHGNKKYSIDPRYLRGL